MRNGRSATMCSVGRTPRHGVDGRHNPAVAGALGHQDSAAQDSFAGGLLDCPHYTRPEDYQGMRVPEVLLSGDHERIRRWRLQQSLLRTRARRPDLLAALAPDSEYNALLAESGQHQQAGGGKAGDGEKN